MEELLAAIFGFILEALGEVLIELALGGFADLSARGIRRLFVAARRVGPVAAAILTLLAGGTAGYLGVLLFPQRIVPVSRFHGASLLASPIITGMCMAFVGSAVRRRGKTSIRLESFAYGSAFAFGAAFVRWIFVH